MSCPECCTWCCPCLSSSKKTSKFSYVRYTQQKISDRVQPEKVFEFPQNKSDVNTHPQMFVEAMSVVRDQPTSVVGNQPVPKLHLDDTIGAKYELGSKSLPYFRPPVKSTLRQASVLERSYREKEQLQPSVSTQKNRDLVVRSPSPLDLPILEESTLQQDLLPALQFSLLVDMQKNIFTVHLHHATNLPENDQSGMMNPFVVLYMMPNKEEVFESVVLHQTLNPKFDQSFEFHLQYQVYDNSKSKLVGGVAFPLEGADIFGVVMRMQIDQDLSEFFQDGQGDVLLALSYDQRSSSLKGVILKAVNLIKQDLLGSADPYVKIYIYHNNKRIGKWKSTIKKNTLVPIFNEAFHFEINERDIESISLKLVVMDYDRFSRNDVMGTVLIGSSVSNGSGCKHWKEMILNLNSSVCQWHTII